jgi:CPA2 family monovalent cation:H+ antiporter-2
MGVRRVAIPGAIGQTFLSTVLTTFFLYQLGWSIIAGAIVGFSVGVASTVVMIRILTENNLLHTREGHIAIGWLIVEDLLTVFALLLLPMLVADGGVASLSFDTLATSLGIVFLKFLLLGLIMISAGRWAVTRILTIVARTRSDELLTLTVLALIFVIAVGSTYLFGTSIALGAFIAGMTIGQTQLRYQALANSLPLKDAFSVTFFLSVGMLFDPSTITADFAVFGWVLAVVLLLKPLAALLIMLVLKHPFKTSLTVALALAQIGEFSFILVEEASKMGVIPDIGYDVVIACAIVSITLNPLLFKLLTYVQAHHGVPPQPAPTSAPDAVVIGYGPIGKMATHVLEEAQMRVTNIDQNIDTTHTLATSRPDTVFGDASATAVLNAAGIKSAKVLVITIPNTTTAMAVIHTALSLNPKLTIFARSSYQTESDKLRELGAKVICQETETAAAIETTIKEWLQQNILWENATVQ